jgi:molybdopterin synthase catalytic subunit
MQITVLFFATLKDLAGTNRLTLDGPESGSLDDLKVLLMDRFPTLAENLKSAVAAINQEFAFPEDCVKAGDEVAFFPPVSGGSEWPEFYQVAREPIDLNSLTQSITTPATGAICLFSGAVRGETALAGHLPQTSRLEYEAYDGMAVAKMKQVATEIRERWPLVQGIAIVQRVGALAIGEPTVLIACASGHRDQGCFEAARYGIDRLKEIVPVWKKEVGPEGQTWIEGSYTPTPEDKISGA